METSLKPRGTPMRLSLARPLFFAAWVCPTLTLLFGELPVAKIVAAIGAAAITGTALALLPGAAFRLSRLLMTLLFPLSWLWIGYVTLNGSGPTALDALTALVNTNATEATTALGLMVNTRSVIVGLLQLGLLIASYCSEPTPFGRSMRTALAGSLIALMLITWIQILSFPGIYFLPGREDWQNFPYGSLVDLADVWITHPKIVRRPARVDRRVPIEAAVTQPLDAIFVIGETFRYDRDWTAQKSDAAFAPLAKRFGAGLGVMLPKVCASADATAISVPMLVTGVAPERYAEAESAPSGLARLKAAGYMTAWITMQSESAFSAEPRNLNWAATDGYDEATLPVVSSFLRRGDPRNKAIVLHLMDSHAAYRDRYPPMSEPDGLSGEQQEVLRYRRANDHTLTVLSQLASALDDLTVPAFAVYVSDHGENLLADHNGLHFHIGARTTEEAAYVPAFVFWNAAFLSAQDPVARLRRDLAAPSLAHADIYAIWMSFAGLRADLAPAPDPKILGKVRLTDVKSAVSCSSLVP
jgi:glucan phosphoethanolaminetransferase (alkaline phosphatase superfamily)